MIPTLRPVYYQKYVPGLLAEAIQLNLTDYRWRAMLGIPVRLKHH
jgi:hypothetical protein